MKYIGIDPGKSGAIAWLDYTTPRRVGPGPKIEFTPSLGKLTERDLVGALLGIGDTMDNTDCLAVLERVRSSPQMGVVSAFTFGRGYGLLLGALTASNIPFVEVTPNQWQTKMKCRTKGDKNVTKRKAQQLFPSIKITHSNADALLIAKYCHHHAKELF